MLSGAYEWPSVSAVGFPQHWFLIVVVITLVIFSMLVN